jgi:hypothetical protein
MYASVSVQMKPDSADYRPNHEPVTEVRGISHFLFLIPGSSLPFPGWAGLEKAGLRGVWAAWFGRAGEAVAAILGAWICCGLPGAIAM